MDLSIRLRVIDNVKHLSLCNLFEIWRQILNFSNQVGAPSEIQYLLYNQIKSTLYYRKFLVFAIVVII